LNYLLSRPCNSSIEIGDLKQASRPQRANTIDRRMIYHLPPELSSARPPGLNLADTQFIRHFRARLWPYICVRMCHYYVFIYRIYVISIITSSPHAICNAPPSVHNSQPNPTHQYLHNHNTIHLLSQPNPSHINHQSAWPQPSYTNPNPLSPLPRLEQAQAQRRIILPHHRRRLTQILPPPQREPHHLPLLQQHQRLPRLAPKAKDIS